MATIKFIDLFTAYLNRHSPIPNTHKVIDEETLAVRMFTLLHLEMLHNQHGSQNGKEKLFTGYYWTCSKTSAFKTPVFGHLF